ncbi:MAG: 16S rRNA (cytosine(1402)-N(4))-methyltransferase RsmH [Bdellovibrionaceae bacterium]|nr:16S rRNA (cytosine(1402)-N(4))-methyltransferase RsmH [Pseudobdellovibrionaceae bacterium]
MENDSAEKPKRRVRYKGTHPRRFSEKYKELNPEKYAEEIQKIKASGKTPAGTHIPIAMKEIMAFLNPQPGHVVLDATLGYGGHSSEFLKRVSPSGTLIGLDQDPIERPKTQMRLEQLIEKSGWTSQLIVGAINFADAKSFVRQRGFPQVDLILADLGLSSMQIDTPDRGFSYKIEAPFDLRMNPEKGSPAASVLKTLSAAEISELLATNSDEPHARQIAEQLFKDKPETTTDLARSVEKVMSQWSSKMREKEGSAPIRRVFQAFRILVNDEFRVLDAFLTDVPQLLKKGGRVAILSFHSGEDRRVKKSFQALEREGIYSQVAPDIVRPSMEEQGANPRSKSAKLRWAIKA